MPGYTSAVSVVGMFGDGNTHGSPVCSNVIARFQPSHAITSSFTAGTRTAR